MDQTKYQEAQQAYQSGDYRTAAKGFLAAAGRGAVGNGSCYHMAGNALMKLRRHSDAVTVYGHALRDETYDRRGSVLANLGSAHYALGELNDALSSYEAALVEPDYRTPYKALQCIAAVHMERGRTEDAALAYRRAALDEANPGPSKALVNLGLCFMALGRPGDAVEAYQAALGFDGYQGRGKALANLGQAYTALGRYDEAVKAFEKSTELHDHRLSPAALDSFETARNAVASQPEIVDGWVTGEISAVGLGNDEEAPLWSEPLVTSPPDSSTFEDETAEHSARAAAAAQALGFGDDDAVTDFFTRSEDEMKDLARAERRSRQAPANVRVARAGAAAALIVLVFGGLLIAAYFAGFGWPTQAATVTGLLAAYQKAEPVDSYWVAVPGKDVKREMAKIPPVKDFKIESVVRGGGDSTVNVTVTAQKGAPMRYTVTLAREGVGWRVTGVDYNWRSTGD